MKEPFNYKEKGNMTLLYIVGFFFITIVTTVYLQMNFHTTNHQSIAIGLIIGAGLTLGIKKISS